MQRRFPHTARYLLQVVGLPTLRLPTLRLPTMALATAIALASAPHVLAAGGLAGHDSAAPVDYAADRIELQDKAQRVMLSGNVDITQADLRLRTDRALVSYTNAGEMKIQRIDATGAVSVTRGQEVADGDVGTYDFNRRVITLVGHVSLHRGKDVLNGARLVIDLNTNLASVDGRGTGPGAGLSPNSGGGRVSGTFAVPKKGT